MSPRPRAGRPVWLRVQPELVTRIDAAAESDGRTRSDWIRRACERALEGTRMNGSGQDWATTRETRIGTWDEAWQAYKEMCGSDGPSVTSDELHSEYLADTDAPRYGADWTQWLRITWDLHETEQQD